MLWLKEQNMKLIDNVGLSHLIEKLKALIGLKADKTYVDNKVKTDVPTGAKFTDTVYTHPASHPASMITGLPNSLPADGGNADTVGGFTVGTNVPANAKFTDTQTTVNGKTGVISKNDIVALGIPASDTNTTYSEITTAEIDTGTASTLRTITGRRIKYILDKVQGWIGGLTKSDVGLGNVDNTSDLNKPVSTATQTALDGKVDNSRVLTDVPVNAKFTDTIYAHPANHPASIITESTTKKFVSDTEKANWNNKWDYNESTIKAVKVNSATTAKHLIGDDTRNDNSPPSAYMSGGARYEGRAGWQTEFKYIATIGAHPFLTGTYCYLETKTPWSDSSGGYPIQIAYGAGRPCWRVGINNTTWGAWQGLADGGNATTVNGKTVGISVPSNAKFTDTIYTHPGSGTNPHGTTKGDIGLGSVLNYGVATQAESETGTSNAKYMTPLRTKQAINKFKPKIVTSPTEPSLETGDQWHREI